MKMENFLAKNDTVPLYLAPMAGFTDVVFRAICKRLGADVLVTEFVQAVPLIRDVSRTWTSIDFPKNQCPLGVQIFGAQPDLMAHAAKKIVARLRPDFIDLNFGCPAQKVIEQNAGASLLRTPDLLLRIAEAVVKAVPETPVTAKMRLGWDAQNIVAAALAKRLESAGIRAIAIHGRTKTQGYSGEANWEEIAKVAGAVTIPVVGNGDISSGAIAVRRVRETGVSGLMIGRAALGNPWIFSEIRAALKNEEMPPPSVAERWKMILFFAKNLVSAQNGTGDFFENAPENFEICAEDFPANDTDIRWLHTRLHPLTRALPHSRNLRAQLSQCRTLADLLALAIAEQKKCGI